MAEKVVAHEIHRAQYWKDMRTLWLCNNAEVLQNEERLSKWFRSGEVVLCRTDAASELELGEVLRTTVSMSHEDHEDLMWGQEMGIGHGG